MGLLDRIVGSAVSSVTSSASHAIGESIGNAVGGVIIEGGKSITNEMKEKNQNRELEIEQNRVNAEIAMQNQKKVQELPTNCPHCGAPTGNQLVCEYCKSKIME